MDDFHAANGRPMTAGEVKEAADEVRMSYEPGRRPKADYYLEIRQYSIDAATGHKDTTIGDTLVAKEPEVFDDQEAAAAEALHRFENRPEGTTVTEARGDIRKDMWRILSIRVEGAPQPQPAIVTKAVANKHRRIVEKAGGAHRLGMMWLDGETTEAQEEALFAHFGDLDNKEREKVVNVLETNPAYANQIWTAGLVAATA
jgi:hypothetical protein